MKIKLRSVIPTLFCPVLFAANGLFWAEPLAAEEPLPVHLKVAVHNTNETSKSEPVIVVSIGYAMPPDDDSFEPFAIATKGTIADLENPSQYRLIATSTKGGKEVVPIERVILTGIQGGTVSAINLVPKAILKIDYKYSVEFTQADFLQPASPGFVHATEKDDLSVPATELKAEVDYIHMRTLENKVELKQGDHLGAASFSYSYRSYQPGSGGGTIRFFETSIKGDVDLLSEDNESYFNSIVAKISAFQLRLWKASESFQGAYFVGLEGSFESDKNFDTIDGAAGLAFKAHVKNPLTTFLHDAILDATSTRRDENGRLVNGRMLDAGVAPLFSLNYDYVTHVTKSNSTRSGSHRLKGGFTWDWPLARKFNVPLLNSDFDADMLISFEAIYDVDMAVVRNNSKIVLDVRQRRANDDGFSFTLSYERGKATPTFENVETLLAGIKVSL
jgi:hypothetical protein